MNMTGSTRREFLRAGGMGAGALALSRLTMARSGADRPDIVLIIADDMGISDLGCYGSEIDTPNIDRLAAGGLRFRNFYCEPMCIPARAVLLTGIYETKSLNKKRSVSSGCVTIAEALRAGGYATAMSGKWHLGADEPPCTRGFDRFFGTLLGAGSFYAPLSLMRDNDSAESEFDREDFYYTDAITDNAVKYIEDTPRDKPMFLYTAYTAAHWPLHARPEDIAKYRGRYAMGWDKLRAQRFSRMQELGVVSDRAQLSPRDPDVPAWVDTEHKLWQQRRMEVYAAQIECMDRGIGRIVRALERNRRLDNTIIMFTVDNGACHVEYGPTRKGDFLNETTRDGRPLRPGNVPEIMPGPEDTWQSVGRGWANVSNTPYRLFKLHAHEGGVRNSLIVRWPKGLTGTGKITGAVAHMIDIMPTLLDGAGVSCPESYRGKRMMPMDGRSMLGVLQGKPPVDHDPMFWSWARGKAVIHGNWKLVRVGREPWELYNIDADPTELNDLAKTYPEKVKSLEALWTTWSQTR